MEVTTADQDIQKKLYRKKDTTDDEEKRAHKLYEKILKMVRSVLGSDITRGHELLNVGKKLVGSNIGVFSRDEVVGEILDHGEYFYIVNTDISQAPGTHWMLLYQKNDNLYFYDSFGRKWNKMIPELKMLNMNIKNFDTTDREQLKDEEDCGARVISISLLIKLFDIQTALLV